MANIPNEKAQEISQRINVVINSRLFNINLVELAEERKETAEAIKQAQERLAVAELNQAYQAAQREYAMSVPEES